MQDEWNENRERLMEALAAGKDFEVVCRQMKLTREEGEKLRRDSAFQEEVLRRTEYRLAWMLPKVLRTLEQQMRGKDTRLAQGAAKELLHRSDINRDQQTGSLSVTFAGVRKQPGNPAARHKPQGGNRGPGKERREKEHTDSVSTDEEAAGVS